MIMRTKVSNIISPVLGVFLLLIGYAFSIDLIFVLIECAVVIKFWMMSKRSGIMMIVAFFFTMYLIPIVLHFGLGIPISAYTVLNNLNAFRFTLIIQTVFLLIVGVFVDGKIINPEAIQFSKEEFKRFKSDIGFWIMVVGCFACIFLGRSGATIFDRGGYGQAGAYGGSALFEYFYVFFLLCILFSNNSKAKRIIVIALVALYCTRALLFGARVELLQIAILFYVVYLQKRYKGIKLFLGLAIGYLFMLVLGNFRVGLSFDVTSLVELFGYSPSRHVIVTNETEVFYTSTVIIQAIKTGFVDAGYRVVAALYWFVRLLIPSSLIDSKYLVITYLQKNFSACGGGGFFSAYLYFNFGIIGVLLSGMVIARFINKVNGRTKKGLSVYWKIFLTLFITMIPRWYAYSSESFIKIPLYGVLVFWFFTTLRRNRKLR